MSKDFVAPLAICHDNQIGNH